MSPGRTRGPGAPETTAPDEHGLLDLERDVCLALLASVPLGRVVHTHQALPAVRLVNFRLLPDGIYLRTALGGSVLRAAEDASVVAFEADQYDAGGRYGWSVVVVGRATRVTEPHALARLAELPLATWAAGERDEVVRVSLDLVSGRRAGGPVAVQRHAADAR